MTETGNFSKVSTLHGGMVHNGPLSLIVTATTVPVMEFRSSVETAIAVTYLI